MLAVNYSTIRNRLKSFCDKVTDEHETVIVTRKGEKNVVIISLEEYNKITKASRNAVYLDAVDYAMDQLAAGKGTARDLIEDSEDK